MNWMAFFYGIVGSALVAAMIGSIVLIVDGGMNRKPIKFAAGAIGISLVFSTYLGLLL